MESQEKVEVKKLGLMLLLKARYHNTLKGLKSLIENKAVALTLPGWIVELRLFSPVLDMKFSKGFKLFERSYRMDTKLKHWKNKNFHEIVVVICGFGFGVARTSTAFLKEIAELEHMEYQLNNIPSYSTPERIKEYKDRVKNWRNQVMATTKKTKRPTGTSAMGPVIQTPPDTKYEYEEEVETKPQVVDIVKVYQHIKIIHFCNAVSFGRNQPFVMSFQPGNNTRAELVPNFIKLTQDNRKEYVLIPLSNIKSLECEDVGDKL